MENIKILFVEDEAMIMKVSKIMFKKLGYDPDYVSNGKQTIDHIEKYTYDLIILDIGLPDIDGIQLANKIRKYEDRYQIKKSKIYAVTAYDLMKVRKLCSSAGMNDVFNKPLNQSLIENMVSSLEEYRSLH